MIKVLTTISLTMALSQAGMFDSVMDSTPNELIQTTSTSTQSNGLLSSITDSLGVTPTQASGGTAALLQYAKTQTSQNDYATLTNSVPELGSIGSGSMLSSLTDSVSSVDTVNASFKSLGLDASMVQQFIPLIQSFVGSTGGAESESIITKALSGLM